VTRFLRPLLLCLIAALALAFAACGGGSKASSSTDVNTLLKDTFKGDKTIKSGKLNLALNVDAKNAQGVNGPVTVRVSGPFQSQGKQKLPKFKIDFAFAGAGQSITAGLTSTGDKAFVNFKGTEYAVSDQLFKQFKASFEQAQSQKGTKKTQSLSSLGLDPRQWLTNAKNEGDAKVGSDDTIKITGGVNVAKLLDDVNQALTKVRSLGVQGTQSLPSQLTAAQKKQVTDSVKHPTVEIYTGKDDKILRRIVIALGIVPPKGSTTSNGSANFKLDFSISDLNKDQSVSAPANAKPFDQLLSQLGGLGLGGLGGAAGSSGSSSGSGSSGTSGSGTSAAGSNAKLQKYSDCVSKAGSDTAKAQKCAALLKSP
jgi:hypothetical protein